VDLRSDTFIDAAPNGNTVMFTLGLSLVVAIAFGLLPAIEATRFDLRGRLSDAPRAGGRRGWLGRALIAAQMAVCLVLVFCAGLFASSLRNLRAVDLGLSPERLVLATMNPERSGCGPAPTELFYAE